MKNNKNSNNKNKNLTEIVFILDRSGSMAGLEADTIGGFNSLINKQKKEGGEAIVSTILFDDRTEVIHNRVPIHKVEKMTERDYYVRGCTALLDAVGSAIGHISRVHKNASPKNRPGKTLFIITTDGMENASRMFSYDEVKYLIEKEKKHYGWEFLFLGANIDAVEVAGRFGIDKSRAANYNCDREGTALNFEVVSDAICQVRACASIRDDWKDRIDEDYRKRGK